MIDPRPETSAWHEADLPAFRWRRPSWAGRGRAGAHPVPGGRPRRRMRLLAPVLLVALPAGIGVAGASAQAPPEAVTELAPDATDPLAGSVAAAPEVVAARARHESALWRVDAARRSITDLEWEAVSIAADRANLDAGQQELATRLATARVRAREALVAAYIGGRPADLTAVLLTTESASDLAFRTELLTRHLEQRTDTVAEYVELDGALHGAAADVADRAAVNEIARQQAAAELVAAEAEAGAAAADLTVVESQVAVRVQIEAQAVLRASGGVYKAAGSDGSPTPEESGNAKGLAWDLLRQCESGGNYAAVNPSGAFRGAYQFHMTTWYMLGGVGDPIDALTADQDYRAQVLYDMLGAKPWPQCGRYLKMTPEQLQAVVTGIVLPDATVASTADSSSTTSTTDGEPDDSSTTSTSEPSPTSSTTTAAPPR